MTREFRSPQTLRQVIAAMDANIAEAMEQLRTVTASGVWREGKQNRRTEEPGEGARQRARFTAEIAHWRQQRTYWRGLGERFPSLMDRSADEAIAASMVRAVPVAVQRPKRPRPEPEPVPNPPPPPPDDDDIPF